MPRAPRDYAAEYAKRIERGRARGLSTAEARGHREEIRAPGEQSTYETRGERNIARRLRDLHPELTRAESIRLAGKYVFDFGVARSRKLMSLTEQARREYDRADEAYPDTAAKLAELWDETLGKLATPADYDYQPYIDIDWPNPPDYAYILFYH